jgi:nitrite reductase (cytochrome c-552)
MLDAIVAVRRPYDDRNRAEAQARAKESAAKRPDWAQLSPADQEKALAAETKAALLALWQSQVEKDPQLKELGELQRAAQWRLDFVAAENSMGFHAPQEMARILGESIDLSRQAEVRAVSLAGGKLPPPVTPQPIEGMKK